MLWWSEHSDVCVGVAPPCHPCVCALGFAVFAVIGPRPQAAKGDVVIASFIKDEPTIESLEAVVVPIGRRPVERIDAGALRAKLEEMFLDHAFSEGHQVVVKYERAQLRITMQNIGMGTCAPASILSCCALAKAF